MLITGIARPLERFPRARAYSIKLVNRFPSLGHRLRTALHADRLKQMQERQPIEIATLVDVSRDSQCHPDYIAVPEPVGKRTLYIFVDHTVNCSTNTGVQRVTRALASGLVASGERVRYVKWDAGSGQCLLINAYEREQLGRWNGPPHNDEESALYPDADQPQFAVPHYALGQNNWLIVPEVTHITFHQAPVTLDLLMWARQAGLKTGFIFYDAIPLRRQELQEVAPRHACYMQQLLLADEVWPISEWSARDLLAYWSEYEHADSLTMPKVVPLSLSGESRLAARVTEATPSESLILSVGSIEPRKNQIQLIRSFQAHRKHNPNSGWRLTLVGNLHPLVAQEVNLAMHTDSAIRHLGHVSDAELDYLYRTCAFTVFPSAEEGFGLPILESLWYGKPCLCADFGAMREVAQDGGCLMVDTRNAEAMDQGIEKMIADSTLRQVLSAQAVARPIKTWEQYCEEICSRVEQAGDIATRLGPVYYWIDATLQFPQNTGIQRVSRQLARALLEADVKLVAVKWQEGESGFGPVSTDELAFFAQWNGPKVSMWHPWVPPTTETDGWFFMPELPLNRSSQDRQQLMDFARRAGLRTAAVFYDAIPWKMRKIYPAHFAEAHRDYMLGLSGYDLILPISSYSRDDLIDFLGAELPHPKNLDQQIKAAPLAGEFSESSRVVEYAIRRGNSVEILCVGTVEPRKNHETLLRALVLANERSSVPIRLVIAGGAHSIEPKLGERVRAFVTAHPTLLSWEENADDARLRELHMQCDFTVYPSVEEGFGLPILESLWYAKPCVCAEFGAMLELAEGGGCLTTNVRDAETLSLSLQRLAEDADLREQLSAQAANRPFKTWQDYGREIIAWMAQSMPEAPSVTTELPSQEGAERLAAMNLPKRPVLSVCISTYNRAGWLSASLRNWARLYPEPLSGVELLVCDNASTDNTPETVREYLGRPDFTYHRNIRNVGMLGNLRETAHHAKGDYIWIIGDDDLLMPGSIENIIHAIQGNPRTALVYLNYAFTRIEDARTVTDFNAFFREATPIVPADVDRVGPLHAICSRNENFFTAIYTLVLRRDHALKAYSQDTSGRPFSTMLTCIPTTHYVLGHIMNEPGVWLGTPQIVVNLNVSWMKYAPLWILERIPEMYELAELRGVPAAEMDRWRRHSLPSVVHYFQEIFESDPLENGKYFSPARLVRRFKHLPEFTAVLPTLRASYARAHDAHHPHAQRPVSRIFPQPSR